MHPLILVIYFIVILLVCMIGFGVT